LALRDVTEIRIGFDVKEQSGIFKYQSGFDSLFVNGRVTLYIAKHYFFRKWKKLETMTILQVGGLGLRLQAGSGPNWAGYRGHVPL